MDVQPDAGFMPGNPSFSFTATVTDADGIADTHTINITDGAPPTSTGAHFALVVDEKDLADGTTGALDTGGEAGNPDTVDIAQGGLVFTSGSDAIASMHPDLAGNHPTTGTGLDGSITWALSSDGLTLTVLDRRDGGADAGSVWPAVGSGERRDGGTHGDGDAAVGAAAC